MQISKQLTVLLWHTDWTTVLVFEYSSKPMHAISLTLSPLFLSYFLAHVQLKSHRKSCLDVLRRMHCFGAWSIKVTPKPELDLILLLENLVSKIYSNWQRLQVKHTILKTHIINVEAIKSFTRYKITVLSERAFFILVFLMRKENMPVVHF